MKLLNKLLILFLPAFLLHQSCQKPQTKPQVNSSDVKVISPTDSLIRYTGRFDKADSSSFGFSYPGTSIEFSFEGPVCELNISTVNPGKDTSGKEYQSYFYLIVDNKEPAKIAVNTETKPIKVSGLSKDIHTVKLFKLTESFVGKCVFTGMKLSSPLLPLENRMTRRIEFIGNSITCGYGNEGTSATCPFTPETENNYLAYGAIASRQLNAHYTATAYSGKGMYRNYTGTTKESMSLIYDRIFPNEPTPKWDFKNAPQPDLVVINLGANDFAKSVPDSTIFTNTYVNFLKRIRGLYPEAYILCIEGPMTSDNFPAGANAWTRMKNFVNASVRVMTKKGDQKISTHFFDRLSPEHYGCDYHPNLKKHASMGSELAGVIKDKMKW